MKSLLSQVFSVPHVHPRLRKRPPGCTLDCGFKTPESPALRGFVAERCPITGTSLYLVLLSNGYKHPENRLKKFEVSLKITSTNLAKKLPSQALSQTASHRVLQFLSQTAHVRFHRRKRVPPRLSEKDRTQRLTRRNRSVSDGGGITTLGAFHTFWKPCVARCQNGKLCRFWVLVRGALEECREPAGQRCAYACRCSEGIAAPLGCVIQ